MVTSNSTTAAPLPGLVGHCKDRDTISWGPCFWSARERIWRTVSDRDVRGGARELTCSATTDAFRRPHRATEQEAPAAGPRAVSEDWERLEAQDLLPAPTSPAPEVDPADLERRMAAHAELPVVEGGLAFSVVDAGTGQILASRDPDTALVPASTLLLTAAAVLREYSGDEVLRTPGLRRGRRDHPHRRR